MTSIHRKKVTSGSVSTSEQCTVIKYEATGQPQQRTQTTHRTYQQSSDIYTELKCSTELLSMQKDLLEASRLAQDAYVALTVLSPLLTQVLEEMVDQDFISRIGNKE